jgi:uncharacterized membrane protein
LGFLGSVDLCLILHFSGVIGYFGYSAIVKACYFDVAAVVAVEDGAEAAMDLDSASIIITHFFSNCLHLQPDAICGLGEPEGVACSSGQTKY